MKKFSLLAISLIVLFISSCKKDEEEEAPSIQYYSTNIYTEADFDGYIVKSILPLFCFVTFDLCTEANCCK